MSKDTELLRRFVEERAEGPFTELVQEHLNLVYSAALREMNGDGAMAEDVSQAVFTELARKAPRLLGHPSLAPRNEPNSGCAPLPRASVF